MRPLPPERLDLGDVVARWMRSTDVEALVDAQRTSFDELHQYMPWATALDEITVERTTEFFERTEDEKAEHRSVAYPITVPPDDTPLGIVGANARIGPGGVEIGYWVRTDEVGRGLVSRTVAALTDALLGCDDVERVEIHCDVANTRSAAIPRRLGYDLVEVRDKQPQTPGETGREMIWRRTAPILMPRSDLHLSG